MGLRLYVWLGTDAFHTATTTLRPDNAPQSSAKREKRGESFASPRNSTTCSAHLLLSSSCPPPLSLSLSLSHSLSQDEDYLFPPLLICLWDGQGCDEALGQDECVDYASFTVYDSCYEAVSSNEEPGEISIPSQVSAATQL